MDKTKTKPTLFIKPIYKTYKQTHELQFAHPLFKITKPNLKPTLSLIKQYFKLIFNNPISLIKSHFLNKITQVHYSHKPEDDHSKLKLIAK